MSDYIDRQAAIDALEREKSLVERPITETRWFDLGLRKGQDVLSGLPSAQPEIIRCKDCKYSDENLRRVSLKWLPCMDMRTGHNWYCGSAERREE